MSNRAIESIIRQATRKDDDILRIITWDTHESVQTEQCQIPNTEWYGIWWEGLKRWDTKYREIPKNYHQIDIKGDIRNIPPIDYDVILIQNTLAHGKQAEQIARYLHLPVIGLEHCAPVIDQKTYEYYRGIHTDLRIFITEWSQKAWGYDGSNSVAIYHGIDTKWLKPKDGLVRGNYILTVANDYVARGQLLGYPIFEHVVNGLPYKLVGNNPGLSQPAENAEALLREYQQAGIFLNTSTISPIPHSLLEASAAGCAIATTLTCAIPEFFEDGVNCVASNDPEELKQKVVKLLNDKSEQQRLGRAARETVLQHFNIEEFKICWRNALDMVSQIPYRR